MFVILSAILAHWLPFSALFKNIDTLIHEFGHALVTLALAGKVSFIELNADHSGETLSSVSIHWTQIPIALAGYMTASLFMWYLFVSHARGRQKSALTVLTAVATAALVLFVHQGYGRTWLLGFIAVDLGMLFLAPKIILRYYFLLIAFLSLEESVFSPLWLNYTAWLHPSEAGDATVLSGVTPFPALFWSIIFSLFALWCAKHAISAFTGKIKQPR